MIGYAAGASITTGTRNTVVGYAAADAIGVGGMNYTVAIGSFALTAATNTSDASVVIGDAAAGNSVGFSSGVAIGHAAAYTNTANALVAIGYESGYANTGPYNTFLVIKLEEKIRLEIKIPQWVIKLFIQIFLVI